MLLLFRNQRSGGRLGLLLPIAGAAKPAPFVEANSDPGRNVVAVGMFGQGSQTFNATAALVFAATGTFRQGSQTFHGTDLEGFVSTARFGQGSQTFAGVGSSGPPPKSGGAQPTKFMKNMGSMMNRRGS